MRFDVLDHVEIGLTSECWFWRGAVTDSGYGYVRQRPGPPARVRAHRLVYELVNGPLAADEQVHHMCEIPTCVNPLHLEAHRQPEHGKRHRRCPHGDEYRRPRAKGGTRCIACASERMKERRAAEPEYVERLRRIGRESERRRRKRLREAECPIHGRTDQ